MTNLRQRAIEDVKMDATAWITEGTANRGWYTCEITGRKFRGEEAQLMLAAQEREIELVITIMQDIEMEESMDDELSEEVQHAAKMALINNFTSHDHEAEPEVKVDLGDGTHYYTKPADNTTKQLQHHVNVMSLNGKAVKLIAINCEDCGTERLIKPQDAFQVKRCEGCQKKHRNAMRAQRRREKRAEAKKD